MKFRDIKITINGMSLSYSEILTLLIAIEKHEIELDSIDPEPDPGPVAVVVERNNRNYLKRLKTMKEKIGFKLIDE